MWQVWKYKNQPIHIISKTINTKYTYWLGLVFVCYVIVNISINVIVRL